MAQTRRLPGLVSAAALAWLVVASCGGSSDGSTPIAATPSPTPNPTPTPTPTPSSGASTATMLGVQTHFSQNWPVSALDRATEVRAGFLRDSLPWAIGERALGNYNFTGSEASNLAAACAAGHRLVLTQVAQNPLYDGGNTASSANAQDAFTDYLSALAQHYGDCIIGFEIGNEINGAGGAGFAAGVDPTAAYIQQLRSIDAALGRSGIAILGGSTNMIGTGFLAELFDAGMLDLVDGVAVHPYNLYGDGLGIEISHLRDVMRSYGSEVPIWATEFSHDTPNEADAASQMIRSIVLMDAAGIEAISWYALIEQSFFPNLKLFSSGRRTAQGDAFLLLNRDLLTLGQARRVDLGDPTIFAYRYGSDHWVIWGTPRTISVPASASARNPQGQAISHQGQISISERPVIVEMGTTPAAGTTSVLFDSLLMWTNDRVDYLVQDAAGDFHPLSFLDGQYDTQLGNRNFRPVRIGSYTGAAGGTGTSPLRATWRYLVPQDGNYRLSACFSKQRSGDGVDVTIQFNGRSITSTVLSGGELRIAESVNAARGDTLDILVGPNVQSGGDAFSYRFIITSGSNETVICP